MMSGKNDGLLTPENSFMIVKNDIKIKNSIKLFFIDELFTNTIYKNIKEKNKYQYDVNSFIYFQYPKFFEYLNFVYGYLSIKCSKIDINVDENENKNEFIKNIDYKFYDKNEYIYIHIVRKFFLVYK